MGNLPPCEVLLEVLSDPEAMEILDALKPSFSVEGARQKEAMQSRLRHSSGGAATRRLRDAGLLVDGAEGWRIPSAHHRLAYQLIASQKPETEPLQAVAESGLPLRGSSWLDLGCGSGALLRAARQQGAARTCGVDVDPDTLALARLADQAAGYAGEYLCAPSDALPVAGGAFDVVTSLLAFQHFRVRETLAELRRCLRPGGVLFLRLHGTGYYWELCRSYLRRRQIPVYPVRCLAWGWAFRLGAPQSRAMQDGWLKFEVPLTPSWLRRDLAARGFRVHHSRVLRTLWGAPVFFDILARLEPPAAAG